MGSTAVAPSNPSVFMYDKTSHSLPAAEGMSRNSTLRVLQKRCVATGAMQAMTATEMVGNVGGDDTIKGRRAQASELAEVWREIQGCSDWCELVDPLDPLLRREIIRYGELVNASYKAFDLDPSSRRYLNCKYGKKSILGEVGLHSSNYDVTKYIYATPDVDIPTQNTCSRWVGYVAVSSDAEVQRLGRRDIVVSFRGTVTNSEWVANLMSSLTAARMNPHDPRPEVKVELGFLGLYTSDDVRNSKFGHGSCREQLLCEITRLINLYKDEDVSITLTGHSMGSSLALLFGYDLAELGLNVAAENKTKIPITVYSFGGPRVGNMEFKKRCEELGVKVLRMVNVNDPITKLPGVFLNENFRVFPWKTCFCYAHVGVELSLDFFKMRDPSCVHDLGHMIGLLRCPTIDRGSRGGESMAGRIDLGQLFMGMKRAIDAAANVCNMVQSLGF